jgi:hypothetical protein
VTVCLNKQSNALSNFAAGNSSKPTDNPLELVAEHALQLQQETGLPQAIIFK